MAGSRSLLHALLGAGLVDELQMQLFPLILDTGMRAFPERPEPIYLQLVSSRPLDTGMVLQTYRVTG